MKPKSSRTSTTEPRPVRFIVLETFARFWERVHNSRVLALYGGAGSGKSVSIAQRFVLFLLQGENLNMLVARKTLPSLRITAYKLIIEMLDEMGIPYDHNKTERVIRYGTNQIYFTSIDDREKLKSSEFNYIWVEEASDIQRKDFLQLNIRLRRRRSDGKKNQLFLSFNPIDAHHWLITDLVEGKPNPKVRIHHSTYKDNPFLSQDDKEELEALIEKDYNYYRVYALGLPGVLENLIYKNYKVERLPPAAGLHVANADALGLDFGYNNQMALVAIRFYEGRFYIKELLYVTGWTTQKLIEWLKAHLVNKTVPIYADSAEPDRIDEICGAGFNCWPARKEVGPGIDYMQSQELVLDSDSPNLITEFRNYKFRETKDGQVLDEPVKFRDHLADAARYAIYTMNAGEVPVSIEVLKKRASIPGLASSYVEGTPLEIEDFDDLDEAEDWDNYDIPGLEI